MTNQFPDYLRLHTEELVEQQVSLVATPGEKLQQAFADLTGWQIRVDLNCTSAHCGLEVANAPVVRIVNAPPSVVVDSPKSELAERSSVERFVSALNELLGKFVHVQHELRRREAELAAGVPIVHRTNDENHLADRLEAVLKGGAEALGCQAAGLYLLDEATTELKLRACWGISRDRLLDPARPLRSSFADLEAMLGHAVVLEDTSLLPNWHSPEDFPSAVCVPLSSATTLLGTLWFFCERTRDFSAKQTNLAEIIAGRIVSDLEREILLTQSVERHSAQIDSREFAIEPATKRGNTSKLMPWVIDGWEVAGDTSHSSEVHGSFVDWCVLPDGTPALALASADGHGSERCHTATLLYGALKSHANYSHDCRQMLDRLNETMWAGSAGDQLASLIYFRVDGKAGRLSYCGAGEFLSFVVQGNRTRRLCIDASLIGSGPDAQYHDRRFSVGVGDILVSIVGKPIHRLTDRERIEKMSQLAKLVRKHREQRPEQLVQEIHNQLTAGLKIPTRLECTALVLKRTNGRGATP